MALVIVMFLLLVGYIAGSLITYGIIKTKVLGGMTPYISSQDSLEWKEKGENK